MIRNTAFRCVVLAAMAWPMLLVAQKAGRAGAATLQVYKAPT